MKKANGNISLWRKNTDFKISECKDRVSSSISSMDGDDYQSPMVLKVLWEH